MDYYITSNGELRHAAPNRGWEKNDHKYIKREWKNGKWQYTYKQDAKKNTTTNAAKNASTNSKSKTILSSVGKKISSTIDNAVAKATIENRGKLSLQTRSAITKGRNAVTAKTSAPKVSKEYQEEVAYNSKKNDYPTEIKEKVIPEKVISEKVIPEKVISEKVISEKVIPEKVISESNGKKSHKKETAWLDAAKKKLDNFGDWASDKLSDIGDDIKDIADDGSDWIGDRMDDLHAATIGKVKDSLGYDKRDLVNQCALKRDEAASDIDRAMKKVESRIAASNGKVTDKTREGVEAKIKVFLTPACEDYAKFDADYTRAKEMYDATPLGKIDIWVNKRESSASESDDARAVQKRLELDRTFQRTEAEFIANQLACMAVNNYISEHDKRKTVEIYSYYKELEAEGRETYDKLKRYAHTGMDLRRNDNSNIEMDRIDRIILELEDLFDRTKR